jgi:pectate lyase
MNARKALLGLYGLLVLASLLISSCANESRDSSQGSGTGTGTDTGTGTGGDASIAIVASGGWFEAAWVEWNALSGASGYAAYWKEAAAADSAYAAVDSALIRSTRLDLPGLKGDRAYDIKIVPIVDGAESGAQASVVSASTSSFDRSGFAFLPSSPNGSTTGGYAADGTVAAGTTILYVNDANKDSLQLAVTKGSTTATYTGLANIMKARESAKSAAPLIVRFLGTVNPPTGNAYANGLLDIKANSNVTFEGIGTKARLYGWGVNIRAAANIEVRNLAFYMFPDDSVSIQVDNRNVWVHNNDFLIGADGGGDNALGDGSCDIKANSSYVTVSYNDFQGTGKSSLCGLDESVEFFVSYHHNWFNTSHSRHPRVRTGTIHVYDNYFLGSTTYGVGAAMASSVFVQNNYFENCVRPMIIASQGHDMKNLSPGTGDAESILSGEAGGTIKAEGNYMDSNSAAWFDASVDTGNAAVGGAVYNGFDLSFAVNSYPCSLDSAADAKAKVLAYAGRLGGGTLSGIDEPSSGGSTDSPETTDPTDTTGGLAEGEWASLDIGTAAGGTSVIDGVATLTGSGKFESTAQSFRYYYTAISGDFTLTARLESFTGASSNQGWAGLLMAPSLEGTLNGSALLYAAAVMRGDSSYYYGHRLTTGGASAKGILAAPAGSQSSGLYLKLRRSGNVCYESYSWDGNVWGAESSSSFDSLPSTIFAGCLVSGAKTAASAVFKAIQIAK